MNEQKITFKYIMQACRRRFEERKRKPKSLKNAIEKARNSRKNAIITEIKLASPSRGRIFHARGIAEIEAVKKLALAMQSSGACAISVLTEEEFFKGNLSYLSAAREVSSLPVLRKDFIFSELQAYESYFYGADALLLIPALLSMKEIKSIKKAGDELGVEIAFEVHSKEDIKKAIKANAEIFLINNRDKNSLKVDLRRTEKLGKAIEKLYSGKEIIKISASGIKTRDELEHVLNFADAALIGTSIIELNDFKKIENKIRSFVYGS